MKTFSIKTFGCKVNQYESQVIREKLLADGYNEIDNNGMPSLCIVNTCCVTNKAEKKSAQWVRHIKRAFPSSELVVTGCSVKKGDSPLFSSGISSFSGRTRAFVKIQEGCDQFCSYCILPYVRGRSTCRDLREVLEEIKRLAANGYKEIVLTGIHLGDFSKLAELLRLLEDVNGLLRVRLSSIEPQDVKEDIIDLAAESKKICRHLHIPLQSGCDKILKLMNRGYTVLEYKRLIEKIRLKMPDICFTTDIIVGFPGETEEDFLDSCNAITDIGFTKVHVFPYSHRLGTTAANFSGIVPKEEIKRRAGVLTDTADKISIKIKREMIGKEEEALTETAGKGFTSGYLPVRIKNFTEVNKLVKVKIIDLDKQNLVGIALNFS